jgi:aconitate hydratase
VVTDEHVKTVAGWKPQPEQGKEVPFMPGRVVLQDFTGVPAVVDLAAMRDAILELGGDPDKINPLVPTDLVIDHSVQVDHFGTSDAFRKNVEMEMQRNRERYALIRWGQKAFRNFRVVPPGTGIVHQVNLEYLASVVRSDETDGTRFAFPDTLVGTDSHTTMINGLGVVGWGVGGIEAEAVMLGQPYFMQLPEVVGMRLEGILPEGATATDLVLTVVQMLREHGVVGRFVEFYGPGVAELGLADRATIANMSPEYGATIGFFPVDAETLRYLERTGRPSELVERVERVTKELDLFRTAESPDPEFSSTLELDIGTIEPCMSGPRRPQDRIRLADAKKAFAKTLPDLVPATATRTAAKGASPVVEIEVEGERCKLFAGSVVSAAITSSSNTSNLSVMIGAGLVARKAAEKGLNRKPWVKTSLAPGSKVVTSYLKAAELMGDLEALGFNLVGYGCTTCIGNSGPLAEPVAKAIEDNGLVVASVLSGNRNFEARVHALVRANYLASPMLVVAYAIAGRMDLDVTTEPLGHDGDGNAVFLKDIWPSAAEIHETLDKAFTPEAFKKEYAGVFDGDETWQNIPFSSLETGQFGWDNSSTYIANPPFFRGMSKKPAAITDIENAKILAWLGDTVTTDHISPAGAIPRGSPAERWLLEHNVERVAFNTFGSRRGNHEVMMRGTFGNIRIKNKLVEGTEGNWTLHVPSGEQMSIYDAAQKYENDGTPLIILAGKEYGTGSSRDWAAKGTGLLGVRAVLTQSFERIHRSNLVGMGVLPMQFLNDQNADTLGLDGTETYEIGGVAEGLTPGCTLRVTATRQDGSAIDFDVLVRLDTPVDVEYFKHGGILQYVLRQLA